MLERRTKNGCRSAIQKISAVRKFYTHRINNVLMASDSLLNTGCQMSLSKGQSDEVRSSILVQVYEFNRRCTLAHNRTGRLNTGDIDLVEVGIHRKQDKSERQGVSSFLGTDSDHLVRNCENRWQEFLFERGHSLRSRFL